MKRLFVPALALITLLIVVATLYRRNRDRELIKPVLTQNTGREEEPPALSTSNQAQVHSPSTPTVADTQSPLPVKKVFQSLFEKYKRALAESREPSFTRFGHEEAMHFLEARLLALSYPKEMQPILFEAALDPTLSRYDRVFAIRTLGALAEEGHKDAETSLTQLAYGSDHERADAGVGLLSPIDKMGVHRSLYFQTFLKGSDSALHAISLWPDDKTVAEMSKLSKHPDAFMRSKSEMVMNRFNILLSSDASRKLESLISNPKGDIEWWTPWAIEAARIRSMPTLKSALRKRLDANAVAAEKRNGFLPNPSEHDAELALDKYPIGDGGGGIVDPCHDVVLLAYFRLGGELTARESRRLRNHGYLGDPKKRLAELLAQK